MLIEQFAEYVRACFAGIWIETFEPDEALREIAEVCDRESWSLATWDIERGLSGHGSPADSTSVGTTDPVAAVQSVSALASDDGVGILVLHGFHRLLGGPAGLIGRQPQVATGDEVNLFVREFLSVGAHLELVLFG